MRPARLHLLGATWRAEPVNDGQEPGATEPPLDACSTFHVEEP